MPGDESRSAIVHRAAGRNGYSRMPPLATYETDDVAIQLLIAWIEYELPSRQSYDEWRSFHFGTDPDGAPEVDADGDGRDNQREFLELTHPRVGDAPASIALTPAGEDLQLTLPDLPGRSLQLESSTNLLDWSPWVAPENNGVARPPGQPLQLSVPMSDSHRFYRSTSEER